MGTDKDVDEHIASVARFRRTLCKSTLELDSAEEGQVQHGPRHKYKRENDIVEGAWADESGDSDLAALEAEIDSLQLRFDSAEAA